MISAIQYRLMTGSGAMKDIRVNRALWRKLCFKNPRLYRTVVNDISSEFRRANETVHAAICELLINSAIRGSQLFAHKKESAVILCIAPACFMRLKLPKVMSTPPQCYLLGVSSSTFSPDHRRIETLSELHTQSTLAMRDQSESSLSPPL